MADYWAERMAETQAKLTEKNIRATKKQLAKYYSNSMGKIIGQFEQTYTKLLSRIEEGKAPTPADLYKLDTYWNMQAQMRKELLKLGDKTSALLSLQFEAEWWDIYNSISLPSGKAFSTISKDGVMQMINQIWCADGKSWSSRIWTNTERLQEALNSNLIDCIVGGKKPTELKQLLQDEFGVSYNRADSLVRTEMAHIQTQAAKQRYTDYGVQEVEILADEDERRCEICGKLHEKRYPIGAAVPIPAHPKCRCCIVPVVK